MPLKKKLLRINELKPGMVSASNITFQNKVLLAKDISITKSIIDRLKKNYIVNEVEVYLEDDFQPLILKIETVQELQDTFNELSINLEDMFYTISNLKVPEIDEIRQFAKKIQEEFNSTGMVIRNIVFYGSGNDTIYRHSINVAAISSILGKWIDLDENEINLLTYSAVLHDFGKIKLDKHILSKGYNLTSEEYDIFKKHTTIGYNLVKKIPYLSNSVAYGILMHHERMDGSLDILLALKMIKYINLLK
ncbi:HD-GYP domain-containing protein [Clostridium sp. LBM24168]